jgi:hypothetical protein
VKFFRVLFLVIFCLSAASVSAHTPLDTDGNYNTPESSLVIENPTKSWTIYEDLDDVNYYKLHLHNGEELRVSLYLSTWGETHFIPNLVIMGPDINGDDEPPFTHPEDLGRLIIKGERPDHPEYEPFTPTSYYYVVSYSHIALEEGDYYLAVFSENHGGRYGMALGYRETFTLYEWLKIPLDLIGIHIWEQQSVILLFGPPLIAGIISLYYLFFAIELNKKKSLDLGKFASVLFIASGTMTLTQMLVSLWSAGPTASALLTLLFIVAQFGLGVLAVRNIGKNWVTWILLGIGGFVFWAGWIIGPTLAIFNGFIQRART